MAVIKVHEDLSSVPRKEVNQKWGCAPVISAMGRKSCEGLWSSLASQPSFLRELQTCGSEQS